MAVRKSARLAAKLKKVPPALRPAFKAFQPFREAEIKKFKAKHGHKPKGKKAVEQWKGINKRAGVAYRAKKRSKKRS